MGRVGGTHGWWGPEAQLLTALEQCRAEDIPPGLHLLTFLRPRNESQPDKVGGATGRGRGLGKGEGPEERGGA